MIINQDKEDQISQWRIGNMPVPVTDKYLYLGQLTDKKGNMKEHINNKKGTTMASTRNILGLSKDAIMVRVRTAVLLELYDKCIIPSLTYSTETWAKAD